jgi:D-alanyl-lipoteichoic acid acyltransferase DltB (MBOAT superfamily)
MLFGSYTFLALIGLLILTLPRGQRAVPVAAAFSLAFYAALSLWYLALLASTAAIDFAAARAIEKRLGRARPLLLVSLAANLGVLAFFKYAGFAAAIANDAGRALFGFDPGFSSHDYPLPVGVSFYTFQSIAYVVDVYRGQFPAIRRFDAYLLYVSFFPQILAGPIERAAHLYPQLESLDRARMAWAPALPLLLRGFVKKFLVADNLAAYVESVFADPAGASLPTLVFATLCFGVQIYCDFSGYTDLARGMARGFGIDLSANFNRPYAAASVTDFWRRWHMTLSSWLRDYVYVPLGGNRGGLAATCRNLFATMTLAGLWHGASYNFLIWGMWHGAALALERCWRHRFPGIAPPRALAWATTMIFVFAGWYVFRVAHTADLLVPFAKLAGGDAGRHVTPDAAAVYALVLFAAGTALERRGARDSVPPGRLEMALRVAAVAVLAYVGLPAGYQTFIYFQF